MSKMTAYHHNTFTKVSIISFLLVGWCSAKNLTTCFSEQGSECWHNDWKARDDTCTDKKWLCRYSYEFKVLKVFINKCYCCRNVDTPQDSDLPDCPLLNGVVNNIEIFKHERSRELTSHTLEVSHSTADKSNNSVEIKGFDIQKIVIYRFAWKKRLESCQISNGARLKTKLWENTWADEIKFQDMFLATLCNQSDPKNHLSQKQIILSNSTFTLIKKIPNLAAHERIAAYRYYVNDKFYFKMNISITGRYDDFDNIFGNVGAQELQIALFNSGLNYLGKIDNFTVMAAGTGAIESEFPVSTVYKRVVVKEDVIVKT